MMLLQKKMPLSHQTKERHLIVRNRHRILFDYVSKKTWGLDQEALLLRAFITDLKNPIRVHYKYVYDLDWKADFPNGLFGRGDLVLTDGKGNFLVVEAKYIDPLEGKTMRTRRTKKRKEVLNQTQTYLEAFRKQNRLQPEAVKGLVLTNEHTILLQ